MGYLLQTTKLQEKLIVLNRRKEKATKPKEEVNFLSLKRVKFVKVKLNDNIFFSLIILLFRILFYFCFSINWSLNC